MIILFLIIFLASTHIWDDLNTELFSNTHGMKFCPSCGTENIIV